MTWSEQDEFDYQENLRKLRERKPLKEPQSSSVPLGEFVSLIVGLGDRIAERGAVAHAYKDLDWSGALAICPYCGVDNGVTRTAEKKCTYCGNEFKMADVPQLIKQPTIS